MGRPIKFRAWNGNKFLDSDSVWNQGEWWGGTWPVFNGALEELIESNIVLEQFTGFLDRNGKEIYEGDIVQDIRDDWHWGDCSPVLHGGVGEVLFLDGAFTALRKDFQGCNPSHLGSAVKVIGNIHQHPDLLQAPPSP